MATTVRNWSFLTVDNTTGREYKDVYTELTVTNMIPTIVYLIPVGLLGILGNILVLTVYWCRFQRTSTRVLIMYIAAFDLVNNICVIPGEVYDLFTVWDLEDPFWCQARLFFKSFMAITVGVTLLAVAIVRYRKVCRPFGWQISVLHSKILCFISAVCGVLFSIPWTLVNGRQTDVPRAAVRGYECHTDLVSIGSVWPILSYYALLTLFILVGIPLITLYVFIGLKAWQHRKMITVTPVKESPPCATSGLFTKSTDDSSGTPVPSRKLLQVSNKAFEKSKDEDSDSCCDNSMMYKVQVIGSSKNGHDTKDSVAPGTSKSIGKHCFVPAPGGKVQTGSFDPANLSQSSPETGSENQVCILVTDENMQTVPLELCSSEMCLDSGSSERQESQTKHGFWHKMMRRLRKETSNTNEDVTTAGTNKKVMGRTTLILILITAVFVVSYTPHIILMLYYTNIPEVFTHFTPSSTVFFHLFLRFYFINSAANPVIYGLCDRNFRKSCLHLFTRVFQTLTGKK